LGKSGKKSSNLSGKRGRKWRHWLPSLSAQEVSVNFIPKFMVFVIVRNDPAVVGMGCS